MDHPYHQDDHPEDDQLVEIARHRPTTLRYQVDVERMDGRCGELHGPSTRGSRAAMERYDVRSIAFAQRRSRASILSFVRLSFMPGPGCRSREKQPAHGNNTRGRLALVMVRISQMGTGALRVAVCGSSLFLVRCHRFATSGRRARPRPSRFALALDVGVAGLVPRQTACACCRGRSRRGWCEPSSRRARAFLVDDHRHPQGARGKPASTSACA